MPWVEKVKSSRSKYTCQKITWSRVCENASYLRIGTSNVELAALVSPKPLGLIAADDWTKEIATKGLPELKQHYRMLGEKIL